MIYLNKDIVDSLLWIFEDYQCDCAICEIALDAAKEIKKLRKLGDDLCKAASSGRNIDNCIEAWQDARND